MKNIQLAFLIAGCLLLSSCSKKPETKTEEPAEKGPVTVEMKPKAQTNAGLKTETVAQRQLTEYLLVTGTVQPIDSRVSQVRSLARGRVQSVRAKIGDRVILGQALAEIDNIEAGELLSQEESAKADLQRLKIQLSTQAKQFERTKRLVAIGAAAQKDLELAEGEQQALQQSILSQESVLNGIASRLRRFGVENGSAQRSVVTTLRSPFAGVVTKAQAAAGEVVDTATDLFTVADLSQVWVQAEVYEKDLGRIRVGQNAFILVDTYPDEQLSGRVTYIGDVLDPQTRTAKVRCELSNPGFRLKVAMFATVRVPTTFSKQAIAIPVSSLQQVDGRSVVFIQKSETLFEMRPVQVGNTVNGQLEILSGLRQAERVVTQGAFHLKSILAGKDLGEE